MLDHLLDAAAKHVHDVGYDGTSVRSVALQAGVAPATAYTYFASKDHLLGEVMWRKVQPLLDRPPVPGANPLERVTAELSIFGRFLVDNPVLAAAGIAALMQPEPEPTALRDRISRCLHDRLTTALGTEATPEITMAIELMWAGAVTAMRLGRVALTDVAEILAGSAAQILGIRFD